MNSIYKNAYVTISAASASSANAGFLHRRSNLSTEPMRFPIRLTSENEVVSMLFYDCSQLDALDSDRNPIEQRGWTYQERILSSRLLIYSASHLEWACRSLLVPFAHPEVLQGSFDTELASMEFATASSSPSVDRKSKLYSAWEHVVEEITKRSLTNVEDSLIIVAGIAAEFQQALGDDYLAGLWRSALLRGLLWHCGYVNEDHKSRPTMYIAPSWSWASRSGAVSYWSLAKNDQILSTVAVEDCTVVLRDTRSPFGDVVGGHLHLRGPVKQALSLDSELFDIKVDHIHRRESVGRVCIDAREDFKTKLHELQEVTCIRITEQSGLILKPIHSWICAHTSSEKKKYRRVGYFEATIKGWLDDCMIESIQII